MTEDAPRVLWTGGWDSSFRILDLAIHEGRNVDPIYFRDPHRPSIPFELAAMENIRASVAKRFGADVAARIGPLRQFDVSDGAPCMDEARRLHEGLSRHTYVGEQYMWLNAVTRACDLSPVEVGIYVNPALNTLFNAEFYRQDGDAYVLAESVRWSEMELLAPFRFPIFELSKLKMRDLAEERGFLTEMYMTHFCHNPMPNGAPCGTCNPCHDVVHEGLPKRLPLSGHIRQKIWPATKLYRRIFAGIRRRLLKRG